jgi:hypothetical protein
MTRRGMPKAWRSRDRMPMWRMDMAKGLRVIDVSDPSSPQEVGFYDTPGGPKAWRSRGRMPIWRMGIAGLRVIDVSDPSSPREAGFYDTPGYAEGVAVLGIVCLCGGCGMGAFG